MSRDEDDESNGGDESDRQSDSYRPGESDRQSDSNCADVPRRPYSLFVRAELTHSELPLSPALGRSPGTTARPRSAILDGDRFFVAGLGDRLDAFEEGLAADRTVADPVVVSEFEDRRLYRVRVTAAGRDRK